MNSYNMNREKELKEFAAFAERKFTYHQEELEETYLNRKLHARDLRKAYLAHRQILEMELLDKMDELLTKDTAYLGPSLGRIKDAYIDRLSSQTILNSK